MSGPEIPHFLRFEIGSLDLFGFTSLSKMNSGSHGPPSLRRAIRAIIMDSSSSKINGEYKKIKSTIIKATNYVEVVPKEKHVRFILAAVSGARPRADIAFCINALKMRLAKAAAWAVALKTLIVIHRALREVDNSFIEELSFHNQHKGRMLNLLHFKDDTSPSTCDYSTWIRLYALYLEESVHCFRALKYDFYRDHKRTKQLDTPALLEQLPSLQQLLLRLLNCQPIGAARYNYIIQYALSIVAAESVKLYVAITDGVLILVDKFFEMRLEDAVPALDIYKRAVEQAQRLSDFFEMCRSLDFGQSQKYVKIEQPPATFLAAMEEYVRNAPQPLMLPSTPNNEENVTPKLIAVPDPKANSEEGSHSSDDSEEAAKAVKSIEEAPPLIPDLLSWDEPSKETASQSMTTTVEAPSNAALDSEVSSEATGWELALSTLPTSDSLSVSSPLSLCKGGAVDRSVLDSLYDTANTKPSLNGVKASGNGVPSHTQSTAFNPFEAGDYVHDQNMFYSGYNQNMFHNPSLAAHRSFMQPSPFVHQRESNHGQFMAGSNYMQMPPQHQGFADQNYLRMAGIHQQPPSLAEPNHYRRESNQLDSQQEKSIIGKVSAISFGNPFTEQGSSLPFVARNQPSSFSLL